MGYYFHWWWKWHDARWWWSMAVSNYEFYLQLYLIHKNWTLIVFFFILPLIAVSSVVWRRGFSFVQGKMWTSWKASIRRVHQRLRRLCWAKIHRIGKKLSKSLVIWQLNIFSFLVWEGFRVLDGLNCLILCDFKL